MKILFLIFILMMFNLVTKAQEKYNPPQTKIIPYKDTVHGFQITDNYRWLEDKKNPEVEKWSHEQTDFSVDFIKKNYSDIPGLNDEIRAFIDRDYIGAPFFKADREFFYAKKKGEQQYKLYTRINGKEILIFDPLIYDKTGKTAISGFVLTRDGNRAAIGTQFKGDEINEYRIINTRNGRIEGSIIWSEDGSEESDLLKKCK
ncbi:MAG: hypothetical protein HZB41_14580 [Ignavibacteriae bacterium]|nr:hypothetical protein [Ignavibacteriota bacterium]